MAKEDKRFQVVFTENQFFSTCKVLKDTETGVLYLFHQDGSGGGLTPLLDKDGKVVVDKDAL